MRYIRWVLQAGVLAGVAVQVLSFGQAIHPLFDSIAHFRLHITVLLVLGVATLLLVRSWRIAAVALTVAIAGVLGMAPALGSIGTRPQGDDKPLVLVQFNMLFRNPSPTKIAEQIRAAKADAVTLEEVSNRNMALLEDLKTDYPYQVFCRSFSVGGVAVLSRWPVSEQGCGEGQGLAWARLEFDGLPVTIASLHLHWPFPFEQAQQITALDEPLRSLPQPVVLGGDFNAAPWSHSVSRVAEATQTHVASGLRLSFRMAPLGFGPWPLLPIDHVLIPNGAETIDARVGAPAGSDHLPVIVRIGLASR